MRAQIDTIANSAQFNGANLASGNFNLNVLISDLVMPRMGGRELAREIRAAAPDVDVIFCSGYDRGDLTAGPLARAHLAGALDALDAQQALHEHKS